MISSAPDWSPVSASTPAHWMKCVVHDSWLTFRVAMCAMRSFGPIAPPRRQPVIANFLLNV